MRVNEPQEAEEVGKHSSSLAGSERDRKHVHRNAVRIEESVQEVDRLRDDVSKWLRERRDHDSLMQYRTQLSAVDDVLKRVVTRVREDFAGIADTDSVASVYCRCRVDDCQTVLVRRFWMFFRDKFDQRDTGPSEGFRGPPEVSYSEVLEEKQAVLQGLVLYRTGSCRESASGMSAGSIEADGPLRLGRQQSQPIRRDLTGATGVDPVL